MRALLSLCTALVLLAGCSTDSPTSQSDMTSAPAVAAVTLDCDATPGAGGIVFYRHRPNSVGGTYFPVEFTLEVEVLRDDPRTPGVQYYCRDYDVTVSWSKSSSASNFVSFLSYPSPISVRIRATKSGTGYVYSNYSGWYGSTLVDVGGGW